MAKIRAILFDKDGTLLDFNATWLNFVREIAFHAAGGAGERASELLEAAGFDHVSETFRSGSAVAAGTSADIIAIMYPMAPPEEQRLLTEQADRKAALVGRDSAVPLPGVVEALGRLYAGGFRLGVATNDATSGAEATLLALGMAHMFDAAYGYDAVANPKPAPDVIHAFADTVGISAGELAMVGDNTHDLEAARAAGAGLSVGVLSGNGTRADLEPLADIIIGSVAELPEHLAPGDQ
ncbi:MAG: HAD family hydrolase [Rhizobiaceae bacterium]